MEPPTMNPPNKRQNAIYLTQRTVFHANIYFQVQIQLILREGDNLTTKDIIAFLISGGYTKYLIFPTVNTLQARKQETHPKQQQNNT